MLSKYCWTEEASGLLHAPQLPLPSKGEGIRDEAVLGPLLTFTCPSEQRSSKMRHSVAPWSKAAFTGSGVEPWSVCTSQIIFSRALRSTGSLHGILQRETATAPYSKSSLQGRGKHSLA